VGGWLEILLFAAVSLGLLGLVLWQPEVSLVLMLIVPVLKLAAMARLALFIRVDMTLVVMLLITAVLLARMLHRGPRLSFEQLPLGMTLVVLLLAGLVAMSLGYTSAPDYGFAKAWRFGLINTFCFFVPILFLTREEDLKRLFVWTTVAATAIAAVVIAFPASSIVVEIFQRGTFPEASPLATAQVVGYGFIIAVAMLVTRHRWGFATGPLWAVVALVCAIAVLYTGSRGPLVGMLLCGLLVLAWTRGSERLLWVFWSVVLAAVGIPLLGVWVPREYLDRVVGLLWYHEIGESAGLRFQFWRYVFGHAGFSLFGSGVGSFSMGFAGMDTRLYPHNIILEMWYECGLLGAALTTLFIVTVGIIGWRLRRYAPPSMRMLVMLAFLLYAFCVLQALKSGDLSDNRFVWFFAGVIYAAEGIARRSLAHAYASQLARAAAAKNAAAAVVSSG